MWAGGGPQTVVASIRSIPGLSQLSSQPAEDAEAGIPLRHSSFTPTRELHPEWWEKAEKLFRKIGSGFLVALLGPRGTGKTQMSVGALYMALRAERSVRYTKAIEIFLNIRATYSRPNACELDAINKFVEPHVLVIDEIQMRGETAFEDRMLAYLIDKRYDAMRDTILIGNLSPDALAESLDPSIVDRMRETGGIVECNWASFRARQCAQQEVKPRAPLRVPST